MISADRIARLKDLMDRIEPLPDDELPPHVVQSKPRTDKELYISNIVEAAPDFHALIDIPEVIDVVREVSLGLFRLNHTYAIYHWQDAITPLHMAGTPIHPKGLLYRRQRTDLFAAHQGRLPDRQSRGGGRLFRHRTRVAQG